MAPLASGEESLTPLPKDHLPHGYEQQDEEKFEGSRAPLQKELAVSVKTEEAVIATVSEIFHHSFFTCRRH